MENCYRIIALLLFIYVVFLHMKNKGCACEKNSKGCACEGQANRPLSKCGR